MQGGIIKQLHRNSQKRFYDKDYIYFITTNTQAREPYFKEDLFCRLLIDNFKLCKQLKDFLLYGFIIIPDHLHLLLKPNGRYNISQIMQSLKKSFSRDMNNLISFANNEGEIHESRLQGKQYSFHLKKNFNIINYNKYISQLYKFNDMPEFSWQQSFHDHVIRHEQDFYKHLNYIATNCIKHNICQDEEKYQWSFLNPEFKDFIDEY